MPLGRGGPASGGSDFTAQMLVESSADVRESFGMGECSQSLTYDEGMFMVPGFVRKRERERLFE